MMAQFHFNLFEQLHGFSLFDSLSFKYVAYDRLPFFLACWSLMEIIQPAAAQEGNNRGGKHFSWEKKRKK